jgi:hypothetical protein
LSGGVDVEKGGDELFFPILCPLLLVLLFLALLLFLLFLLVVTRAVH